MIPKSKKLRAESPNITHMLISLQTGENDIFPCFLLVFEKDKSSILWCRLLQHQFYKNYHSVSWGQYCYPIDEDYQIEIFEVGNNKLCKSNYIKIVFIKPMLKYHYKMIYNINYKFQLK